MADVRFDDFPNFRVQHKLQREKEGVVEHIVRLEGMYFGKGIVHCGHWVSLQVSFDPKRIPDFSISYKFQQPRFYRLHKERLFCAWSLNSAFCTHFLAFEGELFTHGVDRLFQIRRKIEERTQSETDFNWWSLVWYIVFLFLYRHFLRISCLFISLSTIMHQSQWTSKYFVPTVLYHLSSSSSIKK